MTEPTPPNRQPGFTLLELMIAMAILAVMSVFAYRGLNQVVDGAHQREQSEQALRKLQLFYTLLERDLLFANPRPARDKRGDPIEIFAGPQSNSQLMEFTSRGATNIERLGSGFRRIGYRLEQGAVIRQQWPVLDPGPGVEPLERDLLDHVQQVSLRFYADQLGWVDHWPLAAAPGTHPLPRAVELRLQISPIGEIRRIFRIS